MILSSTSLGRNFHVLAEDSSGSVRQRCRSQEFREQPTTSTEAWSQLGGSDQLVSRRRRAVFLCCSCPFDPGFIECRDGSTDVRTLSTSALARPAMIASEISARDGCRFGPVDQDCVAQIAGTWPPHIATGSPLALRKVVQIRTRRRGHRATMTRSAQRPSRRSISGNRSKPRTSQSSTQCEPHRPSIRGDPATSHVSRALRKESATASAHSKMMGSRSASSGRARQCGDRCPQVHTLLGSKLGSPCATLVIKTSISPARKVTT